MRSGRLAMGIILAVVSQAALAQTRTPAEQHDENVKCAAAAAQVPETADMITYDNTLEQQRLLRFRVQNFRLLSAAKASGATLGLSEAAVLAAVEAKGNEFWGDPASIGVREACIAALPPTR